MEASSEWQQGLRHASEHYRLARACGTPDFGSRLTCRVAVGLTVLAASLLLFALLMPRPAPAADRMRVAASIPPLADFVRQVGDDRVDVLTLVPPGASPHTYELSPAEVVQVAKARVLILNGAHLEYWAPKLIAAVANTRLEVVDTSRGIPLIGKGPHGANPHVWLDVRQAEVQVRHVRDALIRADPDHARFYEANAAAYLAKLDHLDAEIAAEIHGWHHKQFIAFHPAWVYFARRYGLTQAAVVERSPGREPSPAEVARIVQIAKRISVPAIFAEPQFSPKVAQTIAAESGARVVFLDPLGTAGETGGYIGLMRRNVARMAAVLH